MIKYLYVIKNFYKKDKFYIKTVKYQEANHAKRKIERYTACHIYIYIGRVYKPAVSFFSPILPTHQKKPLICPGRKD